MGKWYISPFPFCGLQNSDCVTPGSLRRLSGIFAIRQIKYLVSFNFVWGVILLQWLLVVTKCPGARCGEVTQSHISGSAENTSNISTLGSTHSLLTLTANSVSPYEGCKEAASPWSLLYHCPCQVSCSDSPSLWVFTRLGSAANWGAETETELWPLSAGANARVLRTGRYTLPTQGQPLTHRGN